MYKYLNPWMFVLYTYLFSWVVWWTGIYFVGFDAGAIGFGEFIPFLWVGSFGPSIAGLFLCYRYSPHLLREVMGKLFTLRLGWGAVGYLYLVAFIALVVTIIIGFSTQSSFDIVGLSTMFFGVPLYGVMSALFQAGPLGEELGWRGVLLNTLDQQDESVWWNDIKVAVAWAFWHIPLAFFDDWRILSWPLWLVLYPVSILFFTKIINSLFRHFERSILYAILVHAVFNYLFAQIMNFALVGGFQLYSAILIFLSVSTYVVHELLDHHQEYRTFKKGE